MKKVVLSLALVAMMSVSFVSCKDAAKEEPAVEETTVTEEVAPVLEEIAPVEAATPTVEAPATEEAAK